MRKGKDFLGEINLPDDKYFGTATKRSLDHSFFNEEMMPQELIVAYGYIKKAAAFANYELQLLSKEKKEAIAHVCDLIIKEKLMEHFPLSIWQAGSGTPTHMNVNEVIAQYAKKHLKIDLHPLDDVNLSQSTNDTFPSAMYIALYFAVKKHLLPALDHMGASLTEQQKLLDSILTIGRTHLRDAVPITYGQIFSGYSHQINCVKKHLDGVLKELLLLPLGGTAIGTKIGGHKDFGQIALRHLSQFTKIPFQQSKNLFHAISFQDSLVLLSGALRFIALSLNKIANDLILLSSGPLSGFNEVILPAIEPGSSIMPAKINPAQCEMMKMVAQRVLTDDIQVVYALMDSPLQLNVYKPLIIYSLFNAISLLSKEMHAFSDHCIKKITINTEQTEENVRNCSMLIVAISSQIGYEKAAQIVQKAQKEKISLQKAAEELHMFSQEQWKKLFSSHLPS